MDEYYVYILTNKLDTVLYIDVTNNLVCRVYEHKNKLTDGFTKEYQLNKLVYYKQFEDQYQAIKREKQLKNWHSGWKWNLVFSRNPSIKDLYEELV